MKIAILIMAMIITLLIGLVIIFKNEADFWKKYAEVNDKFWGLKYGILKEYCDKLENILIFDDESEEDK